MLNKKALAASVSAPPAVYVEEVFSTYLYTGTGATLAINNGIDLSTKGGLVWCKGLDAFFHSLIDTVRGNTKTLQSNITGGESTFTDAITSFNNNGFTLGADTQGGYVNASTYNFCSWTFAEQTKFFDVVTYTGTGSNRTISHNLGSVPGMIIIKRTDTTGAWQVYHSSLANTEYLVLNTTAAKATGATRWNSTTPTSTDFSLGTDSSVNASGGTYVAYLFAHDAGGFGTAGTDNVISCGTFTTDASGNGTVNLGYEPQYVLMKRSSGAGSWFLFDNMREISQTNSRWLLANTADAELTDGIPYLIPSATGFIANNNFFSSSSTYIYMAIRRPMKVPTDATTVYLGSLASASVSISTGFVPDMAIAKTRDSASASYVGSRLQGNAVQLRTSATAAEGGFGWGFSNNTNTFSQTSLGSPVIDWIFRRASGFMDVVCYTGTGSTTTFNHNLGVVPELMLVKSRDFVQGWSVYVAPLTADYKLTLQTSDALVSGSWASTTPTSSVFTVVGGTAVNRSGFNYVNYLFATCPGVSKVGSYTGNGTTQAIACGFTGGARFVLIKRTDDVGAWYVYDTARGMTTLTDPYITLNTDTAESATLGSVTTTTGGFTLNSTILAAINVSGGSYIFLAIA
jgi:hypothetical protein